MLILYQSKNVYQANLSFKSDGKNEDIFRYTKTKRYYRFQYLTGKHDIMKNSLSAREGNPEEETRYKKQTQKVIELQTVTQLFTRHQLLESFFLSMYKRRYGVTPGFFIKLYNQVYK